MKGMKVGVELSAKDWWRLSTLAERRGVTVGQILVGAVRDVVAAEMPVTFPDRVEDMVSRGFPDAVIAHRLGATVAAVSRVRRELGLPPNRLRRERWEHELKGPEIPGLSGLKEAV